MGRPLDQKSGMKHLKERNDKFQKWLAIFIQISSSQKKKILTVVKVFSPFLYFLRFSRKSNKKAEYVEFTRSSYNVEGPKGYHRRDADRNKKTKGIFPR